MSNERDTNEEDESGEKIESGKYYCNTCGTELIIGEDCPYCTASIKPGNERTPLIVGSHN